MTDPPQHADRAGITTLPRPTAESSRWQERRKAKGALAAGALQRPELIAPRSAQGRGAVASGAERRCYAQMAAVSPSPKASGAAGCATAKLWL